MVNRYCTLSSGAWYSGAVSLCHSLIRSSVSRIARVLTTPPSLAVGEERLLVGVGVRVGVGVGLVVVLGVGQGLR